jgi:hypothetical protein
LMARINSCPFPFFVLLQDFSAACEVVRFPSFQTIRREALMAGRRFGELRAGTQDCRQDAGATFHPNEVVPFTNPFM